MPHFITRAVQVAFALRERADSPDRIALITHGAFMDALLKVLFSQSPTHPNTLFYNHYNTGITRIDFNESVNGFFNDRMRVHYMNRISHIPDILRTW